jgi:hypothetical protein
VGCVSIAYSVIVFWWYFSAISIQRQMKIKIKETQIQLAILHYLRAVGAHVGKCKTMGVKRGNRFTFDIYLFRGYPDLCYFFKHKIGFIEVKSGTNKQTPEQKIFQSYCLDAGIKYILAYSVQDVIDNINL